MTTFNSLWWGASLSPYEKMCLKSFIDHGHTFNLYVYEDLEVPQGVVVRDANEILHESEYFDPPAAFSDLFR